MALIAPGRVGLPAGGALKAETKAMGTTVSVQAYGAPGLEEAIEEAFSLIRRFESECTRFDPASPLMVANATPARWVEVPPLCYEAIVEAERAHRLTAGRFDPRVLGDLVALGYDRSFELIAGGAGGGRPRRRAPFPAPWRPRLRAGRVLLGEHPIDLGGIGKGLALRLAAGVLAPVAEGFLIEAGGDCYCAGRAPQATPWRLGIEDPSGGGEPVAVVELVDRACATSSVRVRKWVSGGRQVHHLVDPRSGLPGGRGVASVTVVGPDPATAEVWSKALFLEGAEGLGRLADRKGLAAAWVGSDGELSVSAAMERYVIWRSA